jgi:alpha-beta hydrolase superfamily lysophospholipase
VADGVGGLDLCATGLRFVLGASGLPYAFHTISWGHGLGRWYADLTDVSHRDVKTATVAEEIRRFREAHPDDPIYLIGKSGGTAVVVKALEQVEENTVERAILLSPALSPVYDLSQALKAVSRELVVFWSPLDMIVLGAGTRVFGTADRVRTMSAGMVGFRRPALVPGVTEDTGRDRQYAKLRQVRWTPKMASTGYLGGHVGPDSPIFLKNYILPLLMPESDGKG